jgi:hypothetical protein
VADKYLEKFLPGIVLKDGQELDTKETRTQTLFGRIGFVGMKQKRSGASLRQLAITYWGRNMHNRAS